MLLRFHDLAENKADAAYENFMALQELHVVLAELYSEFEADQLDIWGPNTFSFATPPAKSPHKDKSEVIKALKKKMKRLDPMVKGYNSDCSTVNLDELVGLPTEGQDQLKFRRVRIQNAINILTKLEDNSMNRASLLLSFFDSKIFDLILAKHWPMDTADQLLKILETWGPFYAGGEMLAEAIDRQNMSTITPGKESLTLARPTRFSTGAHATVLCGVDTTKGGDGVVYYIDPNYSDKRFELSFTEFKKQTKPKETEYGTAAFISITCPLVYKGPNYECPHMKKSKQEF
jgi:hypothetical protein